MKIKISYYGQARMVRGIQNEEIEVDENVSVKDAVKVLVGFHGENLKKLLLTPEGELLRSVLLPVNDEVIDADKPGLLKEYDDISIFPAMAGG